MRDSALKIEFHPAYPHLDRVGIGKEMITFDELMGRWNWRPIRNCPGRYVLSNASDNLRPEQLLGADVEVTPFQPARARDTVLVARLDKGGLITYKRAEGTYLHTLNTSEGMERKLRDLGIYEASQTV